MSRPALARAASLALILLLIRSSIARAGSITVATTSVTREFAADKGGTFTVFAYSEENGKANQKNFYKGIEGAATTYNDTVTAPLPAGPQKLTPVVGKKDVDKGAELNNAYVSSYAGQAIGYAQFFNKGGGKVELSAYGLTTPGGQRLSAGKSIDPVSIDPGLYAYSYKLSFSMEVFPTDPFTSFYGGASDTNHANPLWTMTAVAYGPINSIGDLVMTFTSDPSLGLNDATVLADLKTAISVSGGVASVSDYTLFNTSYYVLSPTSYSDEVAATTASVPEPSTGVLLIAGAFVWLAGLGWNKRGRRTSRR
ncbi:MAG: PEP-CTERM sorting domain-containing protein [Pirellulales bacterium]|nr:PEP-CTERM sorting domain-containing protein [Pirellulales bacterium]